VKEFRLSRDIQGCGILLGEIDIHEKIDVYHFYAISCVSFLNRRLPGAWYAPTTEPFPMG
jgi:hypothetical protein